jgi:hypothetical protein
MLEDLLVIKLLVLLLFVLMAGYLLFKELKILAQKKAEHKQKVQEVQHGKE